MNNIRPVSDLNNNIADSYKQNLSFQCEIYGKLQEAERQAELSKKRYSSKEVLREVKVMLTNHLSEDNKANNYG